MKKDLKFSNQLLSNGDIRLNRSLEENDKLQSSLKISQAEERVNILIIHYLFLFTLHIIWNSGIKGTDKKTSRRTEASSEEFRKTTQRHIPGLQKANATGG